MLLRLPLQEPARLFCLARFAPSQAAASANTRLKTALALPTELRPLADIVHLIERFYFELTLNFQAPHGTPHTPPTAPKMPSGINRRLHFAGFVRLAVRKAIRIARRTLFRWHPGSAAPPPFPHSQLARAERVGMPPPRFRQGQVPSSAFRSFRSSPSSLPRSLRTGSPNGGRQGSSRRLRCSTPPVTARRFATISCAGPGGSGLHP